jgi:hypothetical protein
VGLELDITSGRPRMGGWQGWIGYGSPGSVKVLGSHPKVHEMSWKVFQWGGVGETCWDCREHRGSRKTKEGRWGWGGLGDWEALTWSW